MFIVIERFLMMLIVMEHPVMMFIIYNIPRDAAGTRSHALVLENAVSSVLLRDYFKMTRLDNARLRSVNLRPQGTDTRNTMMGT